jgi:hypothetical protein
MINCKNFRENVCAYIDNELNIKERLSFDEHVRSCRECKRELDEMTQIIGLCTDLPQQELPVDFKAELHEKLVTVADRQGSKVISIKKPNGFHFLRTFATIAAGLLLVLLAGSFYKFGFFSPAKMQDSTNSAALAMEQPAAAKDEALANDSGSASSTEMGGGLGVQAKSFTAQAPAMAAPTAGTVAGADRSAAVQNREAAVGQLAAGAGTETVNSRLSTITVSAEDPNTFIDKIKSLAVANNAEIVDNQLTVTFSESMTAAKQANADQTVTAADYAGGPEQQRLYFTMPDTQYEQFATALNNEFGAANVQVGAFVTEDMTEPLNRAIKESNALDNRMQELEKEDSTKNASKMEDLKAQKEAADKRIDELRLGNDFVNVTILVNGK